MPLDISMQEVFNRICAKTGYDQKNFILKMTDVKTDAPLDKTLQQVGCIEFCVLKRSSGGGNVNIQGYFLPKYKRVIYFYDLKMKGRLKKTKLIFLPKITEQCSRFAMFYCLIFLAICCGVK